MEHRVYLSGSISGLTMAEATQWRNEVNDELCEFAEILDPMRDVEAPSPDTLVTESLGSVDPVMMTDRGIVVRDYTDTISSSILIVNLLDAPRVSIGTVAELAWAYQAQIPTIVIIEATKNPHEHPFVREMTSYRVDTVERAILVAKSLMSVPSNW